MPVGESVLRGALLLSLAGILCKLLGAAYRIPLVRLIGDEGIGLYQMAYPIYLVFMALSTAGMPLAVSRLVAERSARGDIRGMRRILWLALILLGGLGLAGGAIMAAGAGFFTRRVVADQRAYPVILSLAPAVPLMSLMAALRGYFQGCRNMLPSAMSQLVEQVVRVATLLALAVILLPLGVERAAAGAAFGAAAGGAAGLALLVWWHLAHPAVLAPGAAAPSPSMPALAWRLLRVAGPVGFGALLLPLMQAIDSVLVPGSLQAIGYDAGRATAALGQLGNAWAVVYVPTTFTGALAISLVPAVTEAWARRERSSAHGLIGQALRASALLCLPAAAGLWILAKEICIVLYGSATAADALRILAPAAFFLGMQGVATGALQGCGHTVAPVRNFMLGFALKVTVTGLLCAMPSFGPRGAGLGTVLGSALTMSLNLLDLRRMTGYPAGLIRLVSKTFLAAAAMLACLAGLGRTGLVKLNPYWRLGILLPAGIAVFGLTLALAGGVGRADVEVLRRLAGGAAESQT